MSLTHAPGPLAGQPGPSNFSIEGPQHSLLMTPFPRRVRGELGGEVVIDTTGAMLLHETGIKAQLYVPLADVRAETLTRTELTTRCPFKGEASYRTVAAGGREAQDALWVYDDPIASASWLTGLAGVYLHRFDRWLDEEDEIVGGGFPDPYHRVDVRCTGRRIVVRAGEEILAESARALLLSETGLFNRYYLPREDVRAALEGPTQTRTSCPYKGTASYLTVRTGGGEVLEDAVWFYEDALGDAAAVSGHVSFWGDAITVEVDGEVVPS